MSDIRGNSYSNKMFSLIPQISRTASPDGIMINELTLLMK